MKHMMIVLLIFLSAVILEVIRELHVFRVVRYQVRHVKLAGLKRSRKLIFLSDLHNCCYGRENDKLFIAIENERPDLILIGGDMLLRRDGWSYGQTVEFICRLPKICKVYYANGNHEQKLKEWPERYRQSYKEYRKRLVRAGVHFLENESDTTRWDDVQIRITGLEIPLGNYERFGRRKLGVDELERRIGKAGGAYEILLAHHPGYARDYQRWGADLILSGHYHGGVVGIPGGGVIAPDFRLFPEYSGGCYRIGDATAVVSRGLGAHSIPIRFMNPAEAVVVEVSGDTF